MFVTLLTIFLSLQALYHYPNSYASYMYYIGIALIQWKAEAYTAILIILLAVMTAPPKEHEKQHTMRQEVPSTWIATAISSLGMNLGRRVEAFIHSLQVRH